MLKQELKFVFLHALFHSYFDRNPALLAQENNGSQVEYTP